MNIRKTAIGLAVSLAAAASFATTSHAANRVPSITKVATKMVVPSVVTLSGSFKLELDAGPGSVNVCAFDLYRNTGSGWQFLGHFGGTGTTDEMSQSFGETQYGMVPYDCSGHVGSEAFSNQFFPFEFDDRSSAWSEAGGTTWAEVSNSKFLGGFAIETFNAGATVFFNNECAFNDAIVVATGPTGGIANVSVNGTKMGTINFWSKKPAYLKVVFKYGTPGTNCSTFQFTETKHGKGGGNNMWLDGDVQIYL